MCLTCQNRFCHVQLAGNSLESVTSDVLKKYLKECSVVKPLHVIKREATSFALVHFATEADAATFYYTYCTQKKRICIRMEDVKVNPCLIDNQPVDYSTFQVEPRVSSSTEVICRCRHVNGTNTTTTTGNALDDEWAVDVQNLKLKCTKALKRKELEMEKVAGEISKLRKKLRYLEDME
ncbi:hypothetical protein PS15m_009581 [Mucor circinelloides]